MRIKFIQKAIDKIRGKKKKTNSNKNTKTTIPLEYKPVFYKPVDSNNVLFVTHKFAQCGIYEYGKNVYEAIKQSKKYNFI